MRLSTISSALLAALVLVFASPAQAQFETEWERTSREDAAEPAPSWFDASTERGIAYGVVDGNERLYVASRAGEANQIRVLDPDTGEDLGDVSISTSGVSEGTLAINAIDVSDDGKIVVSNLAAPVSDTNPFRVYMWAGEDAEPQTIIDYNQGSLRLGDNIDIVGSVDDGTAVIYAAASNVNDVLRWSMIEDSENEGQFVFSEEPTVFAGLASIAAWGAPGWAVGKGAGEEAGFFASGRSVTFIREYDDAAATTGYIEWAPADFNQNVGSGAYVTVGDSAFIATYQPTQRRGALVHLDTQAPDGVWTNKYDSFYGTLPEMGATTENTYGDIATRVNEDGSVTLFVLATNNGVGAYTSESFLPEEPVEPFEPIAFWHQNDNSLSGGDFGFEEGDFPQPADSGNGLLTVGGGDALAADQDGVYTWLQSFSGTEVNAPEGFGSGGSIALQGGTDGVNNGAWIQFEVNTVGYEDVVLSFATQRTSTGFNNNQVSYSTDGETFTDLGEPYDPPSSWGVQTFEFGDALDHEETAYIRLTFDGATAEAGNNRLDNIVIDGTEAEPPMLLDEPVWLIAAEDVPFFANDHTTRGGAYNPATDHLLVASRTGAAAIHVLHPANGAKLGELSMTDVGGGTFPINEVAVTPDGQIFSANLDLNGSAVKVYRWADEDAEPEVVFEGELEPGRYGDVLAVGGSENDVRIYISGSANERIAKLTWDGESVGEAEYIIPQEGDQRARMGIVEVPGQDSLWINHPGGALAKVSNVGGSVGIDREVSGGILPTDFGDIAYFTLDDREYIVSGPQYQADHAFAIIDVTDVGEERMSYRTMGLGENANTNGVGFAAFDTKRFNIIVGATNNAIAAFSLAEHPNTAPAAAEILTPADGTEVRVEGDRDTEFAVTWEEATDPEGDAVLYRWQLSAGSDFSATVVDTLVGTSTSFTTDYETLSQILVDAGVSAEETLTVSHRVVTSDGQLTTEGEASTVTLFRGTMTNLTDGPELPRAFAVHGNYPNPFNPSTNISFDLPEAAEVRVEVYDIVGRRVMELAPQSFQAGAKHAIRVDASNLASGTYLYRVVAEMQGSTRVESGKMLLVR